MVVMETLKYTCVSSFAFMHCIQFAGLRSEVVIKQNSKGHFLFMVVMDTLKYTCAPNFIFMCCNIVSTFDFLLMVIRKH